MAKVKILIAEDEPITSRDIRNILSEDGYEVSAIVSSGEGLLEKAREIEPDIILVDIVLRGKMDGIEAANRIRTTLDVPVIYITAHSDDATLQRALMTGPYGYILKPFKKDELHSTIETVLFKHALELRIRESEEKYRQLFTVVSESILIFDVDSLNIIDANGASTRLYGYTKDELLQMKLTDLSADDHDTGGAERKTTLAVTSDIPVRAHRKKSGEVFSVEISTGFFMLKGKSIGIVSVRDVTRRKNLEDEANMAQKFEAVGILAGGIAHDFNNLLTAISGNIALAKMSVRPDDEVYESIMEIEKASTLARDLSAQLLNFARISRPVIISHSITELLKDSALLMPSEPELRFVFSIPEDLWHVLMDPGQIRRVLYHIINNARDAMPSGGEVRISAENFTVESRQSLPLSEGSYVKISISDKGSGIPAENLGKIFDPYFTTKKTYSEKGMGLGLSLSYSIIKRHHGHISASSEMNHGSTFTFYIPAAKD